jgi:hypothetical protein
MVTVILTDTYSLLFNLATTKKDGLMYRVGNVWHTVNSITVDRSTETVRTVIMCTKMVVTKPKPKTKQEEMYE